jgi:hypothetical protein
MTLLEKATLWCLFGSSLVNILLWRSQVKINRKAGNLFTLLGEVTGLKDRSTKKAPYLKCQQCDFEWVTDFADGNGISGIESKLFNCPNDGSKLKWVRE